MKNLIAAFLIVLLFASFSSRGEGNVKGRVFNSKNNESIVYATVSIVNVVGILKRVVLKPFSQPGLQ